MYVGAVYLEYRECLEQARVSSSFVSCARLISGSFDQLFNTHLHNSLALPDCQYVTHTLHSSLCPSYFICVYFQLI